MDRGGEELLELGSAIEKAVLSLSVQIEHLVHCSSTEPSKPIIHTGVKLPKTNVQTFKSNITEWQNFWEQFEVLVHSRSHVSEPVKLAYIHTQIVLA